jgi:hypothetical protein
MEWWSMGAKVRMNSRGVGIGVLRDRMGTGMGIRMAV